MPMMMIANMEQIKLIVRIWLKTDDIVKSPEQTIENSTDTAVAIRAILIENIVLYRIGNF